MPPTRLLALVLILLFALGGVSARLASAQTQAAGPAAQVDVERTRALIETLRDDAARKELIARLEALLAASEATAAPPPESLGERIVTALSRRADVLGGHFLNAVSFFRSVPGWWSWIERQAASPEARARWLTGVLKIAAILAAGLIVELALNRALARPRRRMEASANGSLGVRVGLLVIRALLEILPIAGFAAACYLTLPFTEPRSATRVVALALVNANVAARAIVCLARLVLVPSGTSRPMSISDETANYLYVWVRRFVHVGVYGIALVEALEPLGASRAAAEGVARLVGFVLAWLVIVLVLQNRAVVADAIRPPEAAEAPARGGIALFRRRLAEVWHVVAILYVAVLYVIWISDLQNGFAYVFRASVLSVLVLVLARAIEVALLAFLRRLFAIRPETLERFPGLEQRANRYLAVVERALAWAVWLAAALAVLQAWQVSTFAWVASDAGRRIGGSLLTFIGLIVVIVLAWEAVNAAVERYLARRADDTGRVAARARTLLPLLRNVVMVVLGAIAVMVGLSELGVNVGPLIAGASVVGLAVGFGAQTLVKDVITGFFIMMEDQFAVGDVVNAAGHAGLVEEITIRTVRLRDLSGNVHILPFSEVTTVENMTKGFSRYVFDVGIAYREDTDEVVAVLRQIGEEMMQDPYYGASILQPLEILGVDRFDDSAVIVKARITTLPIKQWEVGREFNRRMKKRFDELGIEIPFPHRTLYFGVDKTGHAPPARIETAPAAAPPARIFPAGES